MSDKAFKMFSLDSIFLLFPLFFSFPFFGDLSQTMSTTPFRRRQLLSSYTVLRMASTYTPYTPYIYHTHISVPKLHHYLFNFLERPEEEKGLGGLSTNQKKNKGPLLPS